MADAIAIRDAQRHYRKFSALHGSSRQHKADIQAIATAKQPKATAETLIEKRRCEVIDRRVDDMLIEQQGRRRGFTYDQTAAMGLEHLVGDPMDPQTQLPLWRELLRLTKGCSISRAEFMTWARKILHQTSLFCPDKMRG